MLIKVGGKWVVSKMSVATDPTDCTEFDEGLVYFTKAEEARLDKWLKDRGLVEWPNTLGFYVRGE